MNNLLYRSSSAWPYNALNFFHYNIAQLSSKLELFTFIKSKKEDLFDFYHHLANDGIGQEWLPFEPFSSFWAQIAPNRNP